MLHALLERWDAGLRDAAVDNARAAATAQRELAADWAEARSAVLLARGPAIPAQRSAPDVPARVPVRGRR